MRISCTLNNLWLEIAFSVLLNLLGFRASVCILNNYFLLLFINCRIASSEEFIIKAFKVLCLHFNLVLVWSLFLLLLDNRLVNMMSHWA